LRVTRFDEGEGRLVYARALVAHAAAIIDDQAHANRDVFAPEERELLLDLVFKNTEIVLLQTISEAAAIVNHARVQDDEINVDTNLGILTGARLPRRRWGGARNGWNLRQRDSYAEKKTEGNQQRKEASASGGRRELSGSERSNRSLSRR
jgi:hypothetical protein